MPFEAYEATKALSASGAWSLSESCPARFWWSSPWNPKREPDNERHFDIGKALHLAVLQPDDLAEAIVIIEAENYKTNKAKELRDEAYAAGKTPILLKEFGMVVAMDKAIHANRHALELLGDGSAADNEVSYFWDDPQTGTPCKARADRILREHRAIIDLKTADSAAPETWKAAAFRHGNVLRAPWYLDGYEVATGDVMRRYVFIVVEKEPPFIVQVYELEERALAWGRMLMRRALTRFAECNVAGLWHQGYANGPLTIGLPNWAEYRLADREQEGEFRNDKPLRADVRRGMDFLAP